MTNGDHTTSTGMPPIEPSHAALDVIPVQAVGTARGVASSTVRSFADEGKTQVTATLDGLATAVRDVATKLENSGAAPFAKYAHDAADAVAGWSASVQTKSVDELVDDTRTLVRTSPALAVGVSLAAGFILSRLFKAVAAPARRRAW